MRRRTLTGRGLAAALAGLLLLAGSCGWWLVHDAAARGIGLGTGVWSTGRCGTSGNWTRRLPSECGPSGILQAASTVATTCTPLNITTLWGIDSTSRTVEFLVLHSFNGGTSAGIEQAWNTFYTDAACTIAMPPAGSPIFTVYAPTGFSGTLVHRMAYHATAFVNGQTTIYAQKQEVAVAGGSTVVQIVPVRYLD